MGLRDSWHAVLVQLRFSSEVSHWLKAWQREDTEEVRRILPIVRSYYHGNPSMLEAFAFYEAVVLAYHEGRFAEARARFDQLDEGLLPDELRELRLTHLAWCLAHVGEPSRALEVLQFASDASVVARAYRLGACGAALFQAGRARQALPALRGGIEYGAGQLHLQSACSFYVGEVLRLLWEPYEADLAYAAAERVAPFGPFAGLARERLSTVATPYR